MPFNTGKGAEKSALDCCAGSRDGSTEGRGETLTFQNQLEERNLSAKLAMARELMFMGFSMEAVQRILNLPAGAAERLQRAAATEGKE